MSDAQSGGSDFKESGQIFLAVGEAVGELKAIVCLDTLHSDTPAGIPLDQLFQEIGGGIGGLFWISGQEAQAGELVYRGVLIQAEFRVGDTAAGHYLHIHLDPLAWIGHLFIGLWFVDWFLFGLREQV